MGATTVHIDGTDIHLSGNVDVLTFKVNSLGVGGSTQICTNASGFFSTCSSSLRYKTNVRDFVGGMDIVRRLRPIVFDWKADGKPDLGFAAEEVAAIEPRLTIYNKDGQIEGVKYSQITTILVNAVKEQQGQIEQQKKEILELQRQMDVLKKMVPFKALKQPDSRRSMLPRLSNAKRLLRRNSK
jgi:hypothetical protein